MCALFDPVGANDGHHGSCSSVLPRRNALYDAPRVLWQALTQHCNVLLSQSPEERVN